MVLLDRLRSNDKTYTDVVFYDSDLFRIDGFFQRIGNALSRNTVVRTVRFHGCGDAIWSSPEARVLFSAIADLPQLRLLSIFRTTLQLQSLSLVIRRGVELSELDVWDSSLISSNKDVDMFAKSVQRSRLTSLYLKGVNFGQMQDLRLRLESFQHQLDILRLDDTHGEAGPLIDDVFRLLDSPPPYDCSPRLVDNHIQALAGGLRQSSLKDLTLVDLTISDQGVCALAEALTDNENLKNLALCKCRLSDQSAFALARMLKVNGTLTSLEVPGNTIGDKGAQELSEALLSPSSSVTAFGIQGNKKIREQGLEAIFHLAQESPVLESLTLFSPQHATDPQVEIQGRIDYWTNRKFRDGPAAHLQSGRARAWCE